MELFLIAKALEGREKKVIAIPETVRAWNDIGEYAVVGRDEKRTVVRVMSAETECFTRAGATTCTVLLDTYTMKLLGIKDGGTIRIKPAEVETAEEVVLAPERELGPEDMATVAKLLPGKPLCPGDVVPLTLPSGKTILRVVEIRPDDVDGVVFEAGRTKITTTRPVKVRGGLLIDATFNDIGDYKEVKEKVREFIINPLLHPETYKRTGFDPPKGVLISGPPGSGKTLLVKAIVFETDANLVYAHASDILSDSYSESKAALEELFEEATEGAPTILCIEDIDLIAPRRGEATIDVESKLTAALMNLMDNLKTPGVIVIGTTSNIERIEPALRRAGRFDREIELPVPDVNARKEILKVLTRDLPIRVEFGLTEVKGLLDKLMKKYPEKALDAKERLSIAMRGDDIERVLKIVDEGLYEEVRVRLLDEMFLKIAKKTHGFVGADLEALVREAIVNAIHRLMQEGYVTEEGTLSDEGIEKLEITEKDFEEALKYVEPSALKEILIEVPEVHWDDIGGYEEVKRLLKEVIEWPLIRPTLFEATGIEPPKGVLLYGPPGTGKTLLAKAVATESGANFIAVKGPEVLSKWVGEGERKIREIFRKARQVAPTIIFFDEIDSIGQRRGSEKMQHVDSIINQLLTEMDGLESREKVIVIAATNRPDILDPALLRPGRFDRLILIPAPDEKARLEILKVHTRNVPLSSDVDLKALARKAEGYSGADLEALVREATIAAIRRVIKDIPEDATKEEIRAHVKVTAKDFEEAMKRVKASITKELMHYYERMEKNLKASIASKFADEYGKFW